MAAPVKLDLHGSGNARAVVRGQKDHRMALTDLDVGAPRDRRILVVMKLFALVVLVMAAPAYAEVTVSDADTAVTLDCDTDPVITIRGSGSSVTLTGICTSLTIEAADVTVTGSTATLSLTGSSCAVTLDQVNSIVVSGAANRVSYKRTLDAKLKKAKIAIVGADNSVTREKAGKKARKGSGGTKTS